MWKTYTLESLPLLIEVARKFSAVTVEGPMLKLSRQRAIPLAPDPYLPACMEALGGNSQELLVAKWLIKQLQVKSGGKCAAL